MQGGSIVIARVSTPTPLRDNGSIGFIRMLHVQDKTSQLLVQGRMQAGAQVHKNACLKLHSAYLSHIAVDSWAQLGDHATAERRVGVGRMMVGFVCRFMPLKTLARRRWGNECFALGTWKNAFDRSPILGGTSRSLCRPCRWSCCCAGCCWYRVLQHLSWR